MLCRAMGNNSPEHMIRITSTAAPAIPMPATMRPRERDSDATADPMTDLTMVSPTSGGTSSPSGKKLKSSSERLETRTRSDSEKSCPAILTLEVTVNSMAHSPPAAITGSRPSAEMDTDAKRTVCIQPGPSDPVVPHSFPENARKSPSVPGDSAASSNPVHPKILEARADGGRLPHLPAGSVAFAGGEACRSVQVVVVVQKIEERELVGVVQSWIHRRRVACRGT